MSQKGLSLKLFLSDESSGEARLSSDLEAICKKFLTNYVIDIINVSKKPNLAEEYQILATPTLVIQTPNLEKRFVGDFSGNRSALEKIEQSILRMFSSN